MNFCIDAPVIDLPGYPRLEYLDSNSDRAMKDHLAGFASHFKREMRFDRLQFDEDMYGNEDFVGFLIFERAMDLCKDEDQHPCRIVGGGVFADHENAYELDWIWLHPFVRNRGLFGECWKGFTKKFGEFSVAKPISAQMEASLKKRG